MARPPITAKGELLARRQLEAALDYVESLGGGAPAWGAITGTLSSQTDLQTALNSSGGGGGGATQVFVQDTQPAMVSGQPWVWWQTVGGEVSDYYVFDGVV